MSASNMAPPGGSQQGLPLHTARITFERPRIFLDPEKGREIGETFRVVVPLAGPVRLPADLDWLATLNSASVEDLFREIKINGQPLIGFTAQELATCAEELQFAGYFLRELVPIFAAAQADAEAAAP
jgi:hypothetical protein